MNKKILILALVFSILLMACNNKDSILEDTSNCENYYDIRYASEIFHDKPNELTLDIYGACKDKKLPLILGIHGGGWMRGDKKNFVMDKAKYFNELGFVFVSINYRLSPNEEKAKEMINNGTYENRIKYPTHPKDASKAVAWLIKNANEYGIDSSQISLLGHSAGSGIVSLLASDNKFFEDEEINFEDLKCVVLLDGDAYNVTNKASVKGKEISSNNLLYHNAFATPEENIKDNIWYLASPINYLEEGKYMPSHFIVTQGSKNRVDSSFEYHNLLLNSNIYSEILDVSGIYNHEEIHELIGNSKDKIISPDLENFLNKYCIKNN